MRTLEVSICELEADGYSVPVGAFGVVVEKVSETEASVIFCPEIVEVGPDPEPMYPIIVRNEDLYVYGRVKIPVPC